MKILPLIHLIFSTGTVHIIPVLGGYVADSCAGKFNTILGAGIMYTLGRNNCLSVCLSVHLFVHMFVFVSSSLSNDQYNVIIPACFSKCFGISMTKYAGDYSTQA